MKLALPRKWRRQTPIFMMGMGLFGVGVAGFGFEAWQSHQNQLDRLVSGQAVFMAQISTEKLETLEDQNLDYFIPGWLSDEAIKSEDLAKWMGKEVGLVALDDKHFILGARYRNKSALKNWLEGQLLPEESFTITKTDKGEVWSPNFSSQQAFLIMDRWVFAGDSLTTLQTAFSQEGSLSQHRRYKQAFSDLSDSKEWRLYIDLENFLTDWKPNDGLAVYQPLITALGQTLPALGMTAKSIETDQWRVNSKFLLSALAPDIDVPELKNTTIPDLAHYAPNDVMFFLNGQELYTRYRYTKSFLSELNPQFELIFDGLLRAQINRWFGETADLENDFLAKIQGPYALMFDYQDQADWLFITESEVGTTLEDLIRAAQGRFSPRVEVVELPDGTTREELIATPPEAIKINEVERNGWNYSVTQSASLNQGQIAFLQQGKYFLISSSPDLLESALEAKKSDTTSLANNNDFRQAVLFRLGQAESFGFMNMAKVKKLVAPLANLPLEEEKTEEVIESNWWQDFLALPLRNVILSRKVGEGEVMMNWLFFTN